MHKWWARRVGGTFRAIILLTFLKNLSNSNFARLVEVNEKAAFDEWFWGMFEKEKMVHRGCFFRPIDLNKILNYRPVILDPFMGGGTIVVEALRLGCQVVGVDLIPVAWFVTKKEVEPVDLEKLDETFKKIEERLAEKLKAYYKTLCPECLEEGNSRDSSKIDAIYTFWIKKIPCLTCGEVVKLFRNYILTQPKGMKPTVFCPQCSHIFEARSKDLSVECKQCGFSFIPNRGTASPFDEETGKKRRGMYICSKGHLHLIRDATRRLLPKRVKKQGIWYPEEAEIHAVEYFCPRHGRGYKMADDYDKELFEEAKSAFDRRIIKFRDEEKDIFGTLIPRQEKPKAFSDRINIYGYRYFWQMFNERQLLCLSILLEEILKIDNKEIKETFLMIFSSILEYNNMFCEYNYSKKMIFNMFSRHAYGYKVAPVENNLWGVKKPTNRAIGTGSFNTFFLKAKDGLLFQKQPFERYVVGNKTIKMPINDTVEGFLAKDFHELTSSSKNVLLYATDSQDLSFIKGQVDAVITDPPYYDNVMYAELADFFYVWLRLGLKDYYDTFRPLYISKSAEIIVNPRAGKEHEDYIKLLSNVFEECHRVLKDDGIMALTYHHKKPETWAAILEAILKPGFYIVATYPVYSEMSVSTHIRAKGAREFDTIVVARKRKLQDSGTKESEPISWENLKDEIYVRARDMIDRVKETHPDLTNGDIATIVLGKCLEIYSKHYPNIKSGARTVEVSVAFTDIRDIISDLQSAEIIPKSDRITELYLRHLAKRNSIEYNELLKIVQSSEFGVSIEHLKDMNILTQRGNLLVIVDPVTRGKWLFENLDFRKKKLEYYIDAIHYLYNRYKEGKRLPNLAELGEFNEAVATSTLSYMSKKMRDEIYKKILDLVRTAEKEPRGLERWIA